MTNKTTEIIFLLDRSGSMAGLEADTIGGFNQFVKKQYELPGQTKVTAILFDHEYEVLWNGMDGADVQLSTENYDVRGMTALLDAIGKTIVAVRKRLKAEAASHEVIFVITTDGMENASKEFTYDKVKWLIEQQQTESNWEFIFLGANIDTAKEAGRMGISKDKAYDFQASKDGVAEMYNQVNETVRARRLQ